jgi:hypothetical protein
MGALHVELHRVNRAASEVTHGQRCLLLQFMGHIGVTADQVGLGVDVVHHTPPFQTAIDLLADQQHHPQHRDAQGDHELDPDRQIGEAQLHGLQSTQVARSAHPR